MALINCSECNKQFSDKANACPNCGCPIDAMESTIPSPVMFEVLVDECNHDISKIKSVLIERYNWDEESATNRANFITKYTDWRDGPRTNNMIEYWETDDGLKECSSCQKRISPTAENCPHCGENFAKRCPKCKSTDIVRISGLSKGLSATVFGVFAANTVLSNFQCKKCKEKFK